MKLVNTIRGSTILSKKKKIMSCLELKKKISLSVFGLVSHKVFPFLFHQQICSRPEELRLQPKTLRASSSSLFPFIFFAFFSFFLSSLLYCCKKDNLSKGAIWQRTSQMSFFFEKPRMVSIEIPGSSPPLDVVFTTADILAGTCI